MTLQYPALSDQQLREHPWDAWQCQRTMARLVFFREKRMYRQCFDELWSSRKDISFGQNGGFWIGRASIEKNLVQALENSSIPTGSSVALQSLMSPLVEVAADGATAKGMWYCPGVRTGQTSGGQARAMWFYARFAADFIKESGIWRIWHLFCGGEFTFDVGRSYIPGNGMALLPDAELPMPGPGEMPILLGADYGDGYDLPVNLYGITSGWSAYPPEPRPYETFSETFSYGADPFMEGTK